MGCALFGRLVEHYSGSGNELSRRPPGISWWLPPRRPTTEQSVIFFEAVIGILVGAVILSLLAKCAVLAYWLLADRLGLSGVPTIVTYAITAARQAPAATPARLRVPSYAVWQTTVWNTSPLSDAIEVEPQSALLHANGATSSEGDRSPTGPRLSAVGAARRALLAMRASGEIGDDAFHRLEEEIDRLELPESPPHRRMLGWCHGTREAHTKKPMCNRRPESQ